MSYRRFRDAALLMVGSVGLLAAPAVAQVCTEPWTLEETLRIGSLDGEDALSGVLDAEVGPDGRLYVAQQFLPAVAVFDQNGRPSGRIGRAGSGPGEFDGWPVRLGWMGDTLWVSDLAALTFFDLDGQTLGRVYFRQVRPAEASLMMPMRPLADGTHLARRAATTAGGGNMESFFAADRMSVPRLSSDGEVVGTIASVRNRMYVSIPTPSGRYAYAAHPLGGSWNDLTFAVAADGSFILSVGAVQDAGSDPHFELLKIGIAGDTLVSRRIPYEPRRITRDDRAWLTKEFGNAQAGEYDVDSGSSPFGRRDEAARERDRRTAEQAIRFPDTFPPVRRILAGTDGSIWLLRELDLPALRDRWQIYSADGTLEGEIVLEAGRSGPLPWEPRLHVLRASREEVWGVTLGDFDEPYIHEYRVGSTCR